MEPYSASPSGPEGNPSVSQGHFHNNKAALTLCKVAQKYAGDVVNGRKVAALRGAEPIVSYLKCKVKK